MALYCLILLFLLMLWMAAPRRWPFTRGSVQLRQVTLEGQEYALLQGEAANYLGLMQVIGVMYNKDRDQIEVTRVLIRWHPLCHSPVNTHWPIIYPISWLSPGTHRVVYETTKGFEQLGEVRVNPAGIKTISEKQDHGNLTVDMSDMWTFGSSRTAYRQPFQFWDWVPDRYQYIREQRFLDLETRGWVKPFNIKGRRHAAYTITVNLSSPAGAEMRYDPYNR
jgi:hypothetical protein